MKSLSEFWQSAREIALLRSRKLKPKQKQLLKIGCVALAMSLTLGAVPFLKGHASEADDTVTRSDLVESITDPEAITDPADDDSDDSEFNVLFDEVEPILTGAETPFVTGTIQATYSNGVLTLGGSGTLTSTDYSNVLSHFGISSHDLSKLSIGDSISGIDDNCFSGKFNYDSWHIVVTICASVKTIGSKAFYNCSSMTPVFNNGLQSIGSYAFYGCSGFTSLTIPDSVTIIGDEAFNCCRSIDTVTIGTNVRSIGYKAFYQTSLGKVEFKTGTITSYGTSVFGVQDGNSNLDIELPCVHFSIGGVIVNDTNKSNYFGDDNYVDISAYPSIIRTVPKAEATCTKDGCEKHWECSKCGKCFSDSAGTNEVHPESLVIPALGHNLTRHAPVDATCTKAGNRQYWSCSRCHKYFSDAACTQETTQSSVTIPALGHNLTRHAPVAATCTTNGNIEYWTCSRCHLFFSDAGGTTMISEVDTEIPAHHALVHRDAAPATCTTDGNIEYWECSDCGDLFSDENGTNGITQADTVIPAHHALVHRDAAPATCTTDGNTEYWECTVCGDLFSDENGTNGISYENTVIPAHHTLVHHDAAPATCTTDGNIEYWSCSVCGEPFSDENGTNGITQADTVIPAHHTLIHHDAAPATCTTDGNIEYWECSDCGDLFNDENGTNGISYENTVIPAHHTLVHHDAVAATCTEPGNIEYWSCSVCGGLFGDENGTTVLESKDITINTTDHEYAWHTYRNDDGTFFDRKICVNCNDLFDVGHFKYALDEDKSGKEWTTGSDQDLFVKIINIANNPGYSKGDDPMISRLTAVSVDGKQLVKDTEYTASAGSIDIHILPGYLKNLSVGKYTVTVEVSYTFVTLLPDGSEIDDTVALSFNHEFTVVKPSSVPSPGTGESSFPIAVSLALMLIAAYGAVYSFARRKTTNMQTSEAE